MTYDLKHLIDQQISDFQRLSQHQLGLGVKINPRAKLSPPKGGSNGSSSLEVVTSIKSNEEEAITGDVSINGSGGLQTTQSGNDILILPGDITCISSSFSVGHEYTMQAPSALKTIYLHRITSLGLLQLKSLRFTVEIISGKTPNKDDDLIDFAVYEKGNNQFTRIAHFGVHSFNELSNISGNTYKVGLNSSIEIKQSEYWVATQYYGAATSDYYFAQNTVNSLLFISGIIKISSNNNDPLPETISIPETLINPSKTLWFELMDY